ncbi:MAG: HEAT repeat domain-containing protein [Legionellaceae bacterium]|nr:HEAT repeat domain-containing protein [Legionellaceae bacterium]
MRKLILLLAIFTSISAWSKVIVDVYGVDEKTAAQIEKSYAKHVSIIENKKMLLTVKHGTKQFDSKELDKLKSQKLALIENIKKKWGFSHVDFQTINYFDGKDIYTTIEIVQETQPERLKYINKQANHTLSEKNDAIQKMHKYSQLYQDILITNKYNMLENECPVYHCAMDFSLPEFKPHLVMFNNAAIHDQKTIIDTLKNDPSYIRRGAAAFLIGHFSDPKLILSTLAPSINDNDAYVRNNIMRVIGATIAKSEITDINAKPFIEMLNSPHVTDRNKSLYVLYGISSNKNGKKQILQYGTKPLLSLLRLKQPNNHKIAYLILRRISGKELADTDIQGWEKWAKETSSDKKPLIT